MESGYFDEDAPLLPHCKSWRQVVMRLGFGSTPAAKPWQRAVLREGGRMPDGLVPARTRLDRRAYSESTCNSGLGASSRGLAPGPRERL
jgi:hypothetical protein